MSFFNHALKIMDFIRSTCRSFFIYALKYGASQDPDNRDVSQHDNYYYNLRLAKPDYPDHSCAFIRA